ncbi:histidine kinase [Aquimarina sp. MMG016]|uniref:sensor histidine kinase n=1 Tax=Aquimarina sp. MMG016 TaxID=2822690 RepID=UPI001B39F1B6|nr:histidine kinase [Aquimarina sp. MMG016]MBQ4819584.1 histidine kinase [Aquimarina sp. MMG016]
MKHVIFWILYWLLWVLLDVMRGIPFLNACSRYLGCFIEIPFYYLHMYYLWPKYIDTKRYGYYFLIFIPLLIFNAYLVLLAEYYIIYPILLEVPKLPEDFFSFTRVLGLTRAILLWFGPATAIKVFRDYYANKINLEKVEKEQKISELNFLKSQMNPHFLFNTLNNLYSLALKGSKRTPEALLQLSNLLSYMLYDGVEDKISLEKEIHHLNDYIELEKLRFGNRLKLQLELMGDFNEVMIPPLIIIPLAENAFKHCALNERGDVEIQISIAIQNNELQISTINPVKNKMEEGKKNGIGVQNLSKRLQIMYPKKHTFKLEEREKKFYADVCIQLS